MKSKTKRTGPRLTPNQVAALAALAEGLRVEEVAQDWGVSQTVIYRNIERAREKLGGRTTAHAVAIWVRRQPIQLPTEDTRSIALNGVRPARRR